MNKEKNTVSSLIKYQLPAFVVEEYPLFVEFLKNYYEGMERDGESLDLITNLLTYLDVDFYQNNITESCILSQNVAIDDSTINVDSTEGFPDVNGLIQIDNEIILYKNKTATEFLDCSRGVSGVTSISNEFTYSYSNSSTHIQNSKVTNLSYLFLLYFFSKIKGQYLPNFNKNFVEGLNVSNFVKNIKDFYNTKGSTKSFDFIIRSLFNVKNETLYPREYVIKPSDAFFKKKNILKCVPINGGNPLELNKQTLFQEDPTSDPCGNEFVSSYCYVISATRIFTESQPIYELEIDFPKDTNFITPPKTKLIYPLQENDTIVTVDSTIGFSDSGYILIGNEYIKYTDKTINQFLNCTRGYCSTTQNSYEISTEVIPTFSLYGYSSVTGEKIKLDILGVASGVEFSDTSNNYRKNDPILVEKLGFSDDTPLTNSWIFNSPKLLKVTNIERDGLNVVVTTQYPHGLFAGNFVTVYGISNSAYNGNFQVVSSNSLTTFTYEINEIPFSEPTGNGYVTVDCKFKDNVPCDVISVYDQERRNLYVASSGVPSHNIGTGVTLDNQRLLKKIPRNVYTPVLDSEKTSTGNFDIGIFVNGTLANSCVSEDKVTYGEILSVDVKNGGFGYSVSQTGGPLLSISSGITNATARTVVNGSLEKIYVLNGGSGYVSRPSVTITHSSGKNATAEAIISGGRITSILVSNPGSGYTSTPTITISGGGGTGVSIAPIVTGPISSVVISNPGSGYTGTPVVSINTGSGAVAYPIISNGRIVGVNPVNSGSNYLTPPKVFVNDSTGRGNGAEIFPNVVNGQIISYSVVNSGVNYSEGYTTISVVSSGEGAILTPNVRTWTFDSLNILQFDDSYGSVHSSNYGNQYFYYANPRLLRNQLDDNISGLNELITPTKHSPILGWAYDGNPIYGPYGYDSPLNSNSFVRRMVSGYSQNQSRINGPTNYALGSFVEDYTFIGNGDLDRYNGRFCVTPDFPEGTYAYFVSIDPLGNPIFPYIIGPKYYSYPELWNIDPKSTQNNLPENVYRFRDPYENIEVDSNRRIPNQEEFLFVQEDGVSYILQEDNESFISGESSLQLYSYFPKVKNSPLISVETVEEASLAKVDGFLIEESGTNYKVNDRLIFDNTNSTGYNAAAKISTIKGVNLSNYNTNYYKKVTYDNLNGNFSENSGIYGISSGSTGKVEFINNENNNLYVNFYGPAQFIKDEILISDYKSTVGTGISTRISTNILNTYSTVSTANTVGIIDTNITLLSGTGISVGTNLLINKEIVKVFSISAGNTFGVYRGQFGTATTFYGSGTSVKIIPTVNVLNSSLFDVGNYVKIADEIFRIVDINNSNNSVALLRSQLGSGTSSHQVNEFMNKVFVSSCILKSVEDSYVFSTSTGSSSYLNQNDAIFVSSGSTYDSNYVGSFNVLKSTSNTLAYEIPSLGSGVSGTLTYTTDSTNAYGPINSIKITSGGQYYKNLPSVTVESDLGQGAVIVPKSNTSGKINSVKIDDFGYGVNSDYTLKPDLTFTKTLRLYKSSKISKIVIANGGTGFLYPPTVIITGGGGTGAEAEATVKNGSVNSVTIKNSGYGYISPPTVEIKKTFPFEINPYNSTLNFPDVITSSFSTGDLVNISSTGNYPIIFGGLQLSSNISLYAIVGGALDSNQIRLAINQSDALSGNYIQFVNPGSGNLTITSQVGNVIATAVLENSQFLNSEIVKQIDNNGSIIASARVLVDDGWQSNSKTLRVENIFGEFVANNFPVIGETSNSSAYIYEIVTASAKLNVSAFAETFGNFETQTGILSEQTQNIFDGDFYQNYSYVLKNNVDYKDWVSSIRNITHPSGFKVFGNRIVSTGYTGISSGKTDAYVTIYQNIYNDLSLSTFYNYAISQPDYTSLVKNNIFVYNRQLSSSEQILTSKVDRIDDIGDIDLAYVGTGLTNTYYLPNGVLNTVIKEDILVNIDDIPLDKSSYELEYDYNLQFEKIGAKIILSSTPVLNSNISITLKGLNFNGSSKSFPILFNGQNKSYLDEQILISLNGVIQKPQSYTISNNSYLKFSEVPPIGETIDIRRVNTVVPYSVVLAGTGQSAYIIPPSFDNNTSLVCVDGIIQSSDTYNTISTINGTLLDFGTPIGSGSSIYVACFGSGISNRELISTGNSSNIVPITSNITNAYDALIVVDGVIQNPQSYQIGSGSTCLIFDENLNINQTVYICNFNKKINYNDLLISDGISDEYVLDLVLANSEQYLINVGGILQIPGINNSYISGSQSTKYINFVEAPAARTKFFGLLYNRIAPSGNRYIDDISINYIRYTTINGTLVDTDYLQQESDDSICNIVSTGNTQKIVAINNITGNFGIGQTVVSGLASSVSTGVTTIVTTGSGITFTSTLLGTGITLTTTSFSVGSSVGFSPSNIIKIDNELMRITSISSGATTFTVVRGVNPSPHPKDSVIYRTTTSFSVGSSVGFAPNDYILIDGESMRINSISSGNTTFTVQRGRVVTPITYHPPRSLVTKYNPVRFTISSGYTGFNNSKLSYNLTSGGNPYNFNGTPFNLPTTTADRFGQDYSESLLAIINGIIQDNSLSGSFTISSDLTNGDIITFSEAPQEGTDFYGRYLGKLRRLNDISSQFNGVKLSFNMNIGSNIIYSLVPPNSGVDISNNLLIFINGVLQSPGEGFQVLGSTITFPEPPAAGTSFVGYVYIGSDEDVKAVNILPPIEDNDILNIDGESSERTVDSILSSNSLKTLAYFGDVSGVNAQATAITSNNRVIGVQIIDGGSGYLNPPVIYFTGSGQGAQAYCEVENGKVVSVTVTNPGEGYINPPTVNFAKNLSYTKTNRVRTEYDSDNKRLTTFGAAVSFPATSLPLTGQSIRISNGNSFSATGGIIRVIDTTKSYPVYEDISYSVSTGTTLLNCTRGIGLSYNKVMRLNSTNYVFRPNQFISNGSGATGNVINWDSTNNLLFVKRNSVSDFANSNTITDSNGVTATITNASFIQTYFAYGTGVTFIQVS